MDWDNVFKRLSKAAWEKKELTDDEYRQLLLLPNVSEKLNTLVELLRDKKLLQLVKGAEFIESITPKDPRYEKAIHKYNTLSQYFERKEERFDAVDHAPTLWTVYTEMRNCTQKYNRKMSYEELEKRFPSLTEQQIRWGIWEYEEQIKIQVHRNG